jgi:hypothetical protein
MTELSMKKFHFWNALLRAQEEAASHLLSTWKGARRQGHTPWKATHGLAPKRGKYLYIILTIVNKVFRNFPL